MVAEINFLLTVFQIQPDWNFYHYIKLEVLSTELEILSNWKFCHDIYINMLNSFKVPGKDTHTLLTKVSKHISIGNLFGYLQDKIIFISSALENNLPLSWF